MSPVADLRLRSLGRRTEAWAFAAERGLYRETRLYSLFGRRRCRDCGERPSTEIVDQRLW
jgi:hypothetical protein